MFWIVLGVAVVVYGSVALIAASIVGLTAGWYAVRWVRG